MPFRVEFITMTDKSLLC